MDSFIMAVSPEKCEGAPIVGLVAVTLPADSNPLRHVWIDDRTLMVGYDPARLTEDIVTRLIRAQFNVAVIVTEGVPA